MSENQEGRKRAEKGEGTVYWDAAKNTFCAELSVGRTRTGRRKRLKAYGKTEAKAKKALRDKLKDYNAGLDTSNTYTVADAVRKPERRPGSATATSSTDRSSPRSAASS
jgi:hypothetical protein